MPLIDYKCSKCGKTKEILYRPAVDGPEPIAPECVDCKELMERQISLCSFSLKGAGWEKDSYCSTYKVGK